MNAKGAFLEVPFNLLSNLIAAPKASPGGEAVTVGD